MERHLRPKRLNADANLAAYSEIRRYWFYTSDSFLKVIIYYSVELDFQDYLSPNICDYMIGCYSYKGARGILETLSVKGPNEVNAHYLLTTCK